jgi:serine protease Do
MRPCAVVWSLVTAMTLVSAAASFGVAQEAGTPSVQPPAASPPAATPTPSTPPAPSVTLDELIESVVRIKTYINPEARTVENLGRERQGSGIVIDDSGLILTIGYLMVEAYATEVITNSGRTVPANVVGYDHESGFGLLRALEPLRIKPLPFGKSADVKERDAVAVVSGGGPRMAMAAVVASKREFAGNWEYLLDEAIFTVPPHPSWSGAALISREGKLVGVGSLIVGAATPDRAIPGNMFVPIDRLPPILADLIADGRAAGPAKPWVGLSTNEVRGRLIVGNVTPGGPAEKAGLRKGDIIVSVSGEAPRNMADLYRKIWALGPAGTAIPMEVLQDNNVRKVEVQSMNRMDHLKLKSTF